MTTYPLGKQKCVTINLSGQSVKVSAFDGKRYISRTLSENSLQSPVLEGYFEQCFSLSDGKKLVRHKNKINII